MRITILGCGSSGGVPRIGNDWGACDPAEPRNRRRRCSILVESGASRVLVDTSPDIREQLLDAGVDHLDGVVWTHDHADQSHGIDELRVLAIRHRQRQPVWADARTLASLKHKFGYCFERQDGAGFYPPILDASEIDGPFRIGEIEIRPFQQDHGSMPSLGLRFGPIGYANDVVRLPEPAFEALAGVEVLIVDALRYTPHPTHASVAEALAWIERIAPGRAVLTNMHVDLDYATLKAELPAGVVPAYDGMVIEA